MKFFTLALFIALTFSAFSFANPAMADDLTGKWSVTADAGGQVIDIAMELKQTGETFTGTTSSHLGNGSIDGGKVSGKSMTGVMHADIQGSTVDFKIEGTIDGDKITGTFSNAQFGSVPFTATRSK